MQYINFRAPENLVIVLVYFCCKTMGCYFLLSINFGVSMNSFVKLTTLFIIRHVKFRTLPFSPSRLLQFPCYFSRCIARTPCCITALFPDSIPFPFACAVANTMDPHSQTTPFPFVFPLAAFLHRPVDSSSPVSHPSWAC